jgi:hypothetical protein
VKLVRNLIIVLLVLVAAAVGVVMVMGESLVAEGIEKTVPAITKTDVQVGDVSVGPISGTASLENLVIGNPAGFTEPHALRLGKIETKLDIESLFSDKIVIHDIDIVDPEIIFENSKAGQNLQQINENIQAYIGPDATDESGEPVRFVIENFRLRGAKIKITGLGVDELNQEIILPDLHLQGIGEKENGIVAADAAKQIFAAVMDAVKKELVKAQAMGILSDKINLPGGSNLGGIKDKIKGFFSR